LNAQILPYVFILLSFLFGSIPFGMFIARSFGVGDIRAEGSGNIGATNVARVAGFWPAGFLTLFLDVLKGLLVIVPVKLNWLGLDHFQPSQELLWSIGLAAVIGHCFTPWLKFQGGKESRRLTACFFSSPHSAGSWSSRVLNRFFGDENGIGGKPDGPDLSRRASPRILSARPLRSAFGRDDPPHRLSARTESGRASPKT